MHRRFIVVHYMGVDAVRNIVRELGLASFITRLADEIESDYRRWPVFDKSARHAAHSRDGVIELMPISDGMHYAFKYVNGHPRNTNAGLSTVTAFGVLADVVTGYPLLLAELTLTTAIRTAAMSALAARRMARRGSATMAVIGNGAQAEFQVVAFHGLLGIREVRLYDTDGAATEKLERNLRGLCLDGLRVIRCVDARQAVRGADIVTTITADKSNAIIVTNDMIEPGMHLNAVGGDCPGKTELERAILLRDAVRVVVEYAPQSRVEGEVQQVAADYPVIEFFDLLTGAVARRNDTEVTIFDSVGFAIEDFSALRLLHRLQSERHCGRTLDLVPRLDDPKDLFALLRPEPAPQRRAVDAWVAA